MEQELFLACYPLLCFPPFTKEQVPLQCHAIALHCLGAMPWLLHEPLDVVTAFSIFFTALLAALCCAARFQKHLLPAMVVVHTLNVAHHTYLASSCLAAAACWNALVMVTLNPGLQVAQ